MRKIFLLAIFGVSLFGVRGVYGATLTESSAIPVPDVATIQVMPPYPGGDTFNPFFGQDHAYSVTFRGNGQAVVFLRVLFSNNGDTPLKTLTLRLPKVDPEGILAYQVLRDKTCLRYDYNKPAVAPAYQYPCLEYGETNYNDYNQYSGASYYGTNTYKKAKTSLATDTLTVELPDSLAVQKSGSVLLYFRAYGFAKKNVFGAYDYTFETLKVDDTIRNLRVGISPDSDLVMKGAQGNVDYFKESAPIMESSKMMAVGSSFRNTSIDTAISNIGYGTVNKNASNLMPLDSYKVKGAYADSRLKLYAGVAIGSVVIVLMVLLALGFGVWKLFRALNKKLNTSHTGINLTISALAGFVSASIITVLIFLAYFFTQAMSSWSYSGGAMAVLPVFAMLFFVGLIGIFLIFPCIFVGVKRGIWWGLATFVFTLFWLFVAFIVLGLILVGLRTSNGNYPMKIMM